MKQYFQLTRTPQHLPIPSLASLWDIHPIGIWCKEHDCEIYRDRDKPQYQQKPFSYQDTVWFVGTEDQFLQFTLTFL